LKRKITQTKRKKIKKKKLHTMNLNWRVRLKTNKIFKKELRKKKEIQRQHKI
jgi:hypothetical protein